MAPPLQRALTRSITPRRTQAAIGLSANRGRLGHRMYVYGPRSSPCRPLGVPFRTRSAHVVKFRPVRIECARESPRQFANAIGDSVGHGTSPKRFFEPRSFRLGCTRERCRFTANFRLKTLKNWCEM